MRARFRIAVCGLRCEEASRRRILRGRAAFTLVEVLVVVAIIGVLVAILLPAIQAAREASRRSVCQSNLRQLGVALALHANAQGVFPVGCQGYRGDFTVTPPKPARFIAWNVPLLAYLEEQPLQEAINTSLPSYDAANKPAAAMVIGVFLCPSTAPAPNVVDDPLHQTRGLWKGAAFSDYAGIYGVEGFGRRRATGDESIQVVRDDSLGVLIFEVPVQPNQVVDGLSKTAAVAETTIRREAECEWINGQNLFAQDESTPMNHGREAGNEVGSPHPGGASLAFCDGHVEFVAESIEQRVLNALLTRAGGE